MTSLAMKKDAALLDRVRGRPLVCALAVGIALCVFLVGRLVFSGFSVLDDHMVIDWLGKDAWHRIQSTELAQYGTGARYRPFMFLALIGESLIFGPNALPYHVVQLVWFGVFLSAFAWVSFRTIGFFAGLLVLLMVANGHYWGNIWTHSLFAAEQTGSLGLGLAIFGYGLFCSWFTGASRNKLDGAVLLAVTGTLICVGSKENFLPLIPLNIALVATAWRRRAIMPATLAAALCLVFLQVAICYGILHANLTQLSNANGGSGLSARIAAIFHTKRFALRAYLSLAGGFAAAIWALKGRATRPAMKIRQLFVLSGLLIWCGIYVCWEQFFYNGLLPTGHRFDFPSLLIDPILAGAFFYTLMELHDRWEWMPRQFSPLVLKIFFAQICLIFLLWPSAQITLDRGRLLPVRSAVRLSGEHSAAMMRDLGRLQQMAGQHPDWPIIIRATQPDNYEAVLTFPIWLKYSRVANPSVIAVDIQAAEFPATQWGMVAEMRNRSQHGVKDQYVANDAAIRQAQGEGHCYIVEFEKRETRCIRLPYDPGAYFPVVWD